MEFIKGVTFAPFSRKGDYKKNEYRLSLDRLIETTNANCIVLVVTGYQKNAYSEEIVYDGENNVSDEELIDLMNLIKEKGLKVILKPTVNCEDGTWRAHINFFDEDVPCEPKWSNWFENYRDFQLHYATIAQSQECQLFIAGCEMVMSEKREDEWRKLITDIKTVFHGLVSYNTDKYQENRVKWWDSVDVISSSGYYPIDKWEEELDRIEKVIKKYNKPFFFAEIGCMSTSKSMYTPNNWNVTGGVNLKEQEIWYEKMFLACEKRNWINGFVIWDWKGQQYSLENAKDDGGYDIFNKPAGEVVRKYFLKD